MGTLLELNIVRKKLVIKKLREITVDDFVPVREVLQSIDFILGNDSKWEYTKINRGYKAITKLAIIDAKEIVKFIEDNKDKMVMDSIDRAFLTDVTQAYRLEMEGRSEKELRNLPKDGNVEIFKEDILATVNQAIGNINMLAETMGDIL